MTDYQEDNPSGLLDQLGNALGALLNQPSTAELITLLRNPTPIKISRSFTVDANGCIGQGLSGNVPETLFACPSSSEAWVHRIGITGTGHSPANPLTAGEVVVTGSDGGELLFFLPIAGAVCPIQIAESRMSAMHLAHGERMLVVGDGLPVGMNLRMDLQIVLQTGISQYTPITQSPSDISEAVDVTS